MQSNLWWLISFIVLFHGISDNVKPQNDQFKAENPVVTVISTVDGVIHGIDKNMHKVWSSDTGGPLVGAYNRVYDDYSVDNNDKRYAVVPSMDGSLMYKSNDGMLRTKFNAKSLSQQAPFISGEGLVFSSKRVSKLIGFDLKTGKLIFEFGEHDDAFAKAELLGYDSSVRPVWFGRVDYLLTAKSIATGKEEFNISYSELHPIARAPFHTASVVRESAESSGSREQTQPTASQERDRMQVLNITDSHDTNSSPEMQKVVHKTTYSYHSSNQNRIEESNAVGKSSGGSVPASVIEIKELLKDSTDPRSSQSLTSAVSSQIISTPSGDVYFISDAVAEPPSPAAALSSLFLLDRDDNGDSEAVKQKSIADLQEADHSLPQHAHILNLNSPAVAAYFVQDDTEREGGLVTGPVEFREIKVLHRVVTTVASKQGGETSVVVQQASREESSTEGDAGETDGSEKKKQKHGTSRNSVLYALEVSEVQLCDLDQYGFHHISSSADAQRALSGGEEEYLQLDSPPEALLLPSPEETRKRKGKGKRGSTDENESTRSSNKPKTKRRVARGRRTEELDSAEELEASDFSDDVIQRMQEDANRKSTRRQTLERRFRERLDSLHLPEGVKELFRKDHGLKQRGPRQQRGRSSLADPQDALPFEVNHGDDDRNDAFLHLVHLKEEWEAANGGGEEEDPFLGLSTAQPTLEPTQTTGQGAGAATRQLQKVCVDEATDSIVDCEAEVPALVFVDCSTDPSRCEEAKETIPASVAPFKSLRGQHRLRDEFYDGQLFNPAFVLQSAQDRGGFFRGLLDKDQEYYHRHGLPHPPNSAEIAAHKAALAAGLMTLPHSGAGEVTMPRIPSLPHHDDLTLHQDNFQHTHILRMDAQRRSFANRLYTVMEKLLLAGIVLLTISALTLFSLLSIIRSSPELSKMYLKGKVESDYSTQAVHIVASVFQFLLSRIAKSPPANIQAQQPLSIQSHSLSELMKPPAELLTNEIFDQSDPTNNILTPISSTDTPASTSIVSDIVTDASGRRVLTVGSLIVHMDEVLGYGSHGTVVYRGSMFGRQVAVKRILTQFVRAADREMSLLIRSDGHPNVVRYFTKETKSDFVYLGLQLCEMSLKDFVVRAALTVQKDTERKYASPCDELRSSLHQIAKGLAHLHSQRIVHRDIKPHNILCALLHDDASAVVPPSDTTDEANQQSPEAAPALGMELKEIGKYVLKISDMGLSKQLDQDINSFSSLSLSMAHASLSASYMSHGAHLIGGDATRGGAATQRELNAVGTIGWQAPELISFKYRQEGISLGTTTVSTLSSASRLPGLPEVRQPESTERDNSESDSDVAEDSETEGDSTSDPTASSSTNDQTSSSTPATSKRSSEWTIRRERYAQLKKEARQQKKRTLTVDVFSLGCVFYYTLTMGEHPFGAWFEREANIVHSRVNLNAIASDALATNLIAWMVESDPLRRPTSKQVCSHAFFWSGAKRLDFLVELSDRLEKEPTDSLLMLAVESGGSVILDGVSGWDRRLDAALLLDLGRFRRYDLTSVRDLLRVIRNKRHHYNELPAELKAQIGSIQDGFVEYFETRFPQLLLHLCFVVNAFLHKEESFAAFLGSVCTLESDVRFEGIQSMRNLATPSTPLSIPAAPQPLPAVAALLSVPVPVSVASTTSSSGSAVGDVIVWHGSALQATLHSNGWWRSTQDWVDGGGKKATRTNHVLKQSQDFRYRTSLCSHWEQSHHPKECPMKKKGKCIFAHGPLELRIKDLNKHRDQWGRVIGSYGDDIFGLAKNLGNKTSKSAPMAMTQVPVEQYGAHHIGPHSMYPHQEPFGVFGVPPLAYGGQLPTGFPAGLPPRIVPSSPMVGYPSQHQQPMYNGYHQGPVISEFDYAGVPTSQVYSPPQTVLPGAANHQYL